MLSFFVNDTDIVSLSVLPSVNGPTVIQEWKPVYRQRNYHRRATRPRAQLRPHLTIDLTADETEPLPTPTPADPMQVHEEAFPTSPPSAPQAEGTSHLDMPLLEGDESVMGGEVSSLLDGLVNEVLNR